MYTYITFCLRSQEKIIFVAVRPLGGWEGGGYIKMIMKELKMLIEYYFMQVSLKIQSTFFNFVDLGLMFNF